jgi:hypothetical protein
MDDFLNNLLVLITGPLLGTSASVLEISWTLMGVWAFVRHAINLFYALGDKRDVELGLELGLIDTQDAKERRIVIRDRTITERVRLYKQSFFVLIGCIGMITPGAIAQPGRLYALVLGLGLISVQALLAYNSTVNARTRVELNKVVAQRKRPVPIVRTDGGTLTKETH